MIVVFLNSNPRKLKEIELCSKQPVIWLILKRDSTAKKKRKKKLAHVNCGNSHFLLLLFLTHSPKMITGVPPQHTNTTLHILPCFKPLSICLFVYCDVSWSGLACLSGSCSRAMLTGLISIYLDKLPFGVSQALNKCGGGHRECVPRINVSAWHEISVESCNTEGKAWTSLSSLNKHRAGLIAR